MLFTCVSSMQNKSFKYISHYTMHCDVKASNRRNVVSVFNEYYNAFHEL